MYINNPKIDYFINNFNIDIKECDSIRLEYLDGESKIFLYNTERLGGNKPSIEEVSTMTFCTMVNFLTGYEFTTGTEDPEQIYNSIVHLKVLSLYVTLPLCLLQIQYEDGNESVDFSSDMEYYIRNELIEV